MLHLKLTTQESEQKFACLDLFEKLNEGWNSKNSAEIPFE